MVNGTIMGDCLPRSSFVSVMSILYLQKQEAESKVIFAPASCYYILASLIIRLFLLLYVLVVMLGNGWL